MHGCRRFFLVYLLFASVCGIPEWQEGIDDAGEGLCVLLNVFEPWEFGEEGLVAKVTHDDAIYQCKHGRFLVNRYDYYISQFLAIYGEWEVCNSSRMFFCF